MSNYKRYYLENDFVFITVVTYNRQKILIDNVDLLRTCLKKAIEKYNFEIFAMAVLEDHFHLIIKLNENRNYSSIVGSIKKYFSYNIQQKIEPNESRLKRKEKTIWQRRFYDHIIRNEDDLNKHLDYIHCNPVKHKYANCAKDWKYSSFQKFVKLGFYEENWCNFSRCKDMECE